jgi:DNA (cytosine-5)-methyltransferase 1
VTLWLYRRNPAHHRARKRAGYRLDLDQLPCPGICAGGLDGDNHSHYWLEEGTEAMTATEAPRADRARGPDKPPYRVPSMAEISRIQPNGYRVISTFSGAGGSCLGLRMAGFAVLYASEFVAAARDTYLANWPETPVDDRDIRAVTGASIRTLAGLGEAEEIDVLEGSPPCASFSTSGQRERTWGQTRAYSDRAQRVDDLFFEFARLLSELRPRTFIAENVAGLVRGTAKGYFQLILRALRATGYRVQARLLDAQWLGVPQHRERLFFIGVRDDLGLEPAFPTPLGYRYSVRDALPDLAGYRFDTSGVYAARDVDIDREAAPTIAISGGAAPIHHKLTGPPAQIDTGFDTRFEADADLGGDLGAYAIGTEWDRLKPGQKSARYQNLVRPDPAAPSPAVTAAGGNASTASVTHPLERRKFTIPELRRICAFPDDFTLTGTYEQQWERCGRAVPPLMARAVAEVLRDQVLAVADARAASTDG